jgi:hypothetical protein
VWGKESIMAELQTFSECNNNNNNNNNNNINGVKLDNKHWYDH